MPVEGTGAATDLLGDFGNGHVTARQHGLGGFDFRIVHGFGTTSDTASGTTGSQSGTGSVDDQIPFHLAKCAKDVEQEPPSRCSSVDAFGQGSQRNASLLKLVGKVDQMSERSCQPVEPPDDDLIIFASMFEGFRQFGSVGLRAGCGLDENLVAARLFESVELEGMILLIRRNSGVADKHFSNLPKLIDISFNWERVLGMSFGMRYR